MKELQDMQFSDPTWVEEFLAPTLKGRQWGLIAGMNR